MRYLTRWLLNDLFIDIANSNHQLHREDQDQGNHASCRALSVNESLLCIEIRGDTRRERRQDRLEEGWQERMSRRFAYPVHQIQQVCDPPLALTFAQYPRRHQTNTRGDTEDCWSLRQDPPTECDTSTEAAADAVFHP